MKLLIPKLLKNYLAGLTFLYLNILAGYAQPLQGTYTIGGTNPDYATFGAAATALNAEGISGPVTFKVRNGTYTERIFLNQFTGSSCDTPVIFESESGDSTAVTLQFSATLVNQNYTVLLNGADGIKFRKMTIRANNTTYGTVIAIQNTSDCNEFSSCRLIGIATTSDQERYAIILSFNQTSITNNYNRFENNFIENGSFGIYLRGGGTQRDKQNKVIHNTFLNQGFVGIDFHRQDSLEIINNEVITNTTRTDFYGIYVNTMREKFEIRNNRIQIPRGRFGIYLDDADGSVTNSGLVANNFITVGGTGNAEGIFSRLSDRVKVYHNNIHITTVSTQGTRAFWAQSGTNLDIRNNNFVNTGGGYAHDISNASSVINSDFNNLYTTGPLIGYWNVGVVTNLAAWQAASGRDANSLSVDPLYVSNTDLHVGQIDLNGAATSLPEVTTDIDGDPRDAINPDIGADEFTPPATDAGISAYTAPAMPFKHGVREVKVRIRNYGTGTLNTVRVQRQINGTTQPFNFTGLNLASGDATEVTLGTFDFNYNVNYTLKFWTENPNGGADTVPANDTLLVQNIYASLEGEYTIGGVGPDFINFGAATTTLNNGGIAGNVTFKVRSGTYTEQIFLNQFLGSSCERSVVFESEANDSTAVTLQFAAGFNNNYTVLLNGADGIKFRKMTLRSLNSTYNRVLYMIEGVNCTQIESCNIISVSDNFTTVYSGPAKNDNNKFLNNRIERGFYGISIEGINGNNSVNTLFENNIFINQIRGGVFARYQDSVRVVNNLITTNNPDTEYRGIYFNVIRNGFEIKNNKIDASTRRFGIFLDDADGSVSNSGLVANNFITVGGTGQAQGIYSTGSDRVKIYYNNINITSTSAANGRAIWINSGTNLELRNNNFVNNGGGYAIFSSVTTASISSDFNNLYTTGTNLGFWANANRTNLAAWQAASGRDANSLSVDPLYVSNTDLHVGQIDLNGAATPLPEVTTDIDGDPRDPVNPDIGADEFTPSTDDAGVLAYTAPLMPFKHGTREVKVQIRNYGVGTLNTVRVQRQINGTTQPFEFTGLNLASGDTTEVTLGTFDFNFNVNYTLKFWTENPNNNEDIVPSNDTLLVQNIYASLEGEYTIGGASPDFVDFTNAVNTLNNAGIVGAVTFKVRPGTYNERIELFEITGAGENSRITFESETGDSLSVKLTFNSNFSNNYTLRLNGADYITFQKMTLEATNATYGRVVELINGANHNHFYNNLFLGVNGTNTDFDQTMVYSLPQANNNFTEFRFNRFVRGNRGIRMEGISATNPEIGTVIADNIFQNQSRTAMTLWNQRDVLITRNVMDLQFASTFESWGIAIQGFRTNFEISKNQIFGTDLTYGIGITDATASTGNYGRVFNNIIRARDNQLNYGLSLDNTNFLKVYHNTFVVERTNAGTNYAVYTTGGSNLDFKNNIIHNESTGYAFFVNTPAAIQASDYNNLYTNGAVLGRWQADRADLAAWQTASSRDANSISENSLFVSNTNLKPRQPLVNDKGTPLVEVTDDVFGTIRSTTTPDIGGIEFDIIPKDLALDSLVTPLTACNLGNAEPVRIKIQNLGDEIESGFNVSYQINNGTVITENVGALSIASGAFGYYTFQARADLSVPTTYNFKVYLNIEGDVNFANDTIQRAVTNIPLVGAFNLSLPANNATNVAITNTNFSWSASANATAYDFYLWRASDPEPTTPTRSNLTAINITNTTTLQYFTDYNWKVIAKNSCSTSESATFQFRTRGRPDLIVQEVITPDDVIAGQEIEVSWRVANVGTFTTGTSNWVDRVYLSQDQILETQGPDADILLGTFNRLTALNLNESYTNTQTFTLPIYPNVICAGYHIIVVSDFFNAINEENEANNNNFNEVPMQITLPPSPDLQVTLVSNPNNAISGQQRLVGWEITNFGEGPTQVGTWTDRIYFTPNPVFNQSEVLAQYNQTYNGGILAPGASTLQSRTVMIPEEISGTFYFHVFADINNNVLEYNNCSLGTIHEDNNLATGDSIFVFLNPPADLVVTNLTVPAGLSTGANPTISWTVRNEGLSPTLVNSWVDKVYLSTSATFNEGNATLIHTETRSGVLGINATYTVNRAIALPCIEEGEYYVFVFTDANNQVFEFEEAENNNVRGITETRPLRKPDLSVSAITLPANIEQGVPFTVNWTLSNQGLGAITNQTWRDRVYVSTSPAFNINNAQEVGTLINTNQSIIAGGTLNRQLSVTLFNCLSNAYYVHVVSDVLNNLCESNESNNQGSSTTTFEMVFPDLTVQAVTIPAEISQNTPFTVNWTLQNTGQAGINNRTWLDRVFVSSSPTFSFATATQLGSLLNTNVSIPAGGTLARTLSVSLPASFSGQGYIYVFADGFDNVCESNNSNNITRSTNPFITSLPDLTVLSVTAPANISSGQNMTVQWVVRNIGGTITNQTWSDAVYISANPDFSNPILLGNTTYTASINANANLNRSLSVNIPQNLSGIYYVCVKTDVFENINEGTNEDNNQTCSANPTNVIPGPAADLQVTQITPGAAQVTGGQTVNLSFTVSNLGNGITNTGNWVDKVYLSYASTWTPFLATQVREIPRNGTLASNQTYTVNTSFTVPTGLASGTYYLYVFTDANAQVFEGTNENNNIGRSAGFGLQGIAPADLAVSQVNNPTTGFSGQPTTVSWRVDNLGNNRIPPLFTYWFEEVYLSPTPVLNKNQAILLSIFTRINPLIPATFYTDSRTFTLPNGISGDYYLFVVTDEALGGINLDADRSNNRNVARDAEGNPIPITITLTPPADLVPSNLTSSNAVIGQPLLVDWRVDNTGVGVTQSNGWTDRLYLSTDNVLSANDLLLGSAVRNGSLAAGDFYERSRQFNIPSFINEGNYFLILKTDANDVVYEHQAENNNIIFKDILITRPQNADLIITELAAPPTVTLGKLAQITWTTKNQGVNPANGFMREAFYVSRDTILDSEDILVKLVEKNINLNPNGSIESTFSERITRISEGEYYVLGRTNVTNNIPEDNELNNLTYSQEKINVVVPELVLNVLQPDTLRHRSELYYKIIIPENLAGESLILTLKGDSINGNNELYLRYGEVPTRAEYDFSQDTPFRGNQEITIPSLQAGIYYLMSYSTAPPNTAQNITLRARILEFEVKRVETNRGGNTGLVTVKITGAKFFNTTQFRLRNNALNVTIPTVNVIYVNPTTVFATFNLGGRPEAIYDVEAQNGASVARLVNGFTIVPGSGGGDGNSPNGVSCVVTLVPTGEELVIEDESPDGVRPNRQFSFLVRYENQGNIDVPVPTRFLVSLRNVPIAFSVTELPENKKELILELKELNGPPNVLRPGARGEIRVYSKSQVDLLEYLLLD